MMMIYDVYMICDSMMYDVYMICDRTSHLRNCHLQVVTWDFLDKHIYSDKHANPRRNIEIDLQVAINDVISQVMND